MRQDNNLQLGTKRECLRANFRERQSVRELQKSQILAATESLKDSIYKDDKEGLLPPLSQLNIDDFIKG